MPRKRARKGELTASERRRFAKLKEPVKPKMPHGGARPGAGRKSLFAGKEDMPKSILLTPDAAAKLDAAVERTGSSRNDVVCALLLRYADGLTERVAERIAATA